MSEPVAPAMTCADPRLERALALHRQGMVDAASALYEAVLEDRPADVDALRLLGVARRAQGRLQEAVAFLRRALEIEPHHADAWHSLGNAASDLGRIEEAVAAFMRAVDLRPTETAFWYSLGVAQGRCGRSDAAIEAYRKAIALDPGHVGARHNLANQLMAQEQDREAARLLRAVLASEADLAEAHYNLALALLRLGDWTTGFAEYRWRWRVPTFPDRPRWTQLPTWQGEKLRGRSLLVQAEQGLGDTIQLVRLLPMVASLGARIWLEVPRRLLRLMEQAAGAERVLAIGADCPPAELRVPLFDLPHRLGLTLGAIPSAVPYLRAEAERVRQWRARLGDLDRLVVAVCWRGNPTGTIDRGRSLDDPGPLAAALARERTRLVALTEPSVHPLERIDGGLGWKLAGVVPAVEHPGPGLDQGEDAFLDTAALLESVDLVVTTDTALAHLAGALARPTWLLLKHAADWRWLRDRTDSPWYPTMRLFRQTVPGDWAGPLAEIASSVDRLCSEHPRVGAAASVAPRDRGAGW